MQKMFQWLFFHLPMQNAGVLRLLCKNYKLHNSEFVEKTIKEIANISNLVSPTGNKWIYNIATEKGMLFSF